MLKNAVFVSSIKYNFYNMSVNMSQLNNDDVAEKNQAEGKVASESSEGAGEEIRELLKKNLELTEKILKLTERLDKFRKWQQVYGFLKILIIVVPIILGIIYLPALLGKALEPYKELLNIGGEGTNVIPHNAKDLYNTIKGL